MPIIEDFWPRVLGSIAWFFSTIAWPLLVIFVIGWVQRHMIHFRGKHLRTEDQASFYSWLDSHTEEDKPLE